MGARRRGEDRPDARGGAEPAWQDILFEMTGERTLDASAMVEYFQPSRFGWINRMPASLWGGRAEPCANRRILNNLLGYHHYYSIRRETAMKGGERVCRKSSFTTTRTSSGPEALQKEVRESGILSDLRKHRHYEKPSERASGS